MLRARADLALAAPASTFRFKALPTAYADKAQPFCLEGMSGHAVLLIHGWCKRQAHPCGSNRSGQLLTLDVERETVHRAVEVFLKEWSLGA